MRPLDQSYRPSLLAPAPPTPADLYAAHAARSEAEAAESRRRQARRAIPDVFRRAFRAEVAGRVAG